MAKKKTNQCSKCGRKFAMPAHLARHVNTIHGARSATKESTNWLAPLQAYRSELVDRRVELDSRLDVIGQALAALGSVVATTRQVSAPRRLRGPRKGSLKTFIARVLGGRANPMAVKDITAAVLKAGYKTRDKELSHSVGVAASDMPNVVKVERGIYRMK